MPAREGACSLSYGNRARLALLSFYFEMLFPLIFGADAQFFLITRGLMAKGDETRGQ